MNSSLCHVKNVSHILSFLLLNHDYTDEYHKKLKAVYMYEGNTINKAVSVLLCIVLGDAVGSSVPLWHGASLTVCLLCCYSAPKRKASCYHIFVVRTGEDGRNLSQNAPSVWKQLSCPKKSVE